MNYPLLPLQTKYLKARVSNCKSIQLKVSNLKKKTETTTTK